MSVFSDREPSPSRGDEHRRRANALSMESDKALKENLQILREVDELRTQREHTKAEEKMKEVVEKI